MNSRKLKKWKRKVSDSNAVIAIKSQITKTRIKVLICLIVVIVAFVGIYLHKRFRSYDDYKVIKSINVDSGSNSEYLSYGDFVIKYSNDGISYINEDGTVWDESYQMKTPMIDICGEYIAIVDRNTNDIYLYNEEGSVGKVSASYPIIKIEVSKQGVIAALQQDKKANYIEVFDKEGTRLVSHKTLLDDNGYPIDFTLSTNGKKMAVSYITVNNGVMKNKIVFYDFSKTAKNVSDKIAGEFKQYNETVVPLVNFLSDNDLIAVGENVLSIYSMKSKPSIEEEINFKDEIQKVFYSDEYVGFVFKNVNSKMPYRIEVYNLNGSRQMKQEISLDYDNVLFSGENVLMYDDMNCQIISFKGVQKFKHTFRGEMNGIIPIDGAKTFLFMTNSKVQKVKLK